MYLLLSFGIFSIQIINRWPFYLDPVKSFSTPSFIKENFYSSIKFSNWHFFHIGIISGVHPYIPCHTSHSRQKIMCTLLRFYQISPLARSSRYLGMKLCAPRLILEITLFQILVQKFAWNPCKMCHWEVSRQWS